MTDWLSKIYYHLNPKYFILSLVFAVHLRLLTVELARKYFNFEVKQWLFQVCMVESNCLRMRCPATIAELVTYSQGGILGQRPLAF